MKCKNCGAELKNEQMRFCPACGTPVTVAPVQEVTEPVVQPEAVVEAVPETVIPVADAVAEQPVQAEPTAAAAEVPAEPEQLEAAPTKEKGKKKTGMIILISIAAFLVVVIGIAAVLFFTSPGKKLATELKAGNYDEAVEIYEDKVEDKVLQTTIAKLLLSGKDDDIANDIYRLYANEKIDYDKAEDVFEILCGLGFAKNTSNYLSEMEAYDIQVNGEDEEPTEEPTTEEPTEPELTEPEEPEVTSPMSWTESDIADYGEALKKEANGKPIKLTLWADVASYALTVEQAKEFTKLFKDYVNIQVDVQQVAGSDSYYYASDDPSSAADVYNFPSDMLDRFVEDNLLSAPIFFYDAEQGNTADSVAAATMNDTLYAYPHSAGNTYILAYDKRFVTDEQAMSFEEVIAACSDAGKTFIMDSKNSYYSSAFMFTGGLKLNGFESDGMTQKFNNYNIDKVTASVKAFADLFKNAGETFVSTSDFLVVDGMKNGTVGAGVVGSWNIPSLKEALGNNVGYAILPTININGTATQTVNMYGYYLTGINAYSKYPATAQLLAYYVTNYDCQVERAESYGIIPTNLLATEDDVFESDAAMSALLQQAEHSVAQAHIAATFWDPVSKLGEYVSTSSNDFSTKAIKKQVENCITNIRDE